ncbi:MAG: RdgB/HAM1 family non-canonical purine NTP pyrophosphatase [Caedimonas sp.]|nr:RdgB/HAM1 family non-canonical purine NTP pyrophosphatase [Caedimonas sp.]
MTFSTLLLASQNTGKLRELKALVPPDITLYLASDFSAEEPEETGATFQENAALKATFWQQKTNLPCLADDAGICIEALQGAPGVASKEFIGNLGGREKMFEFLAKNKDIQSNPRACCVCVLAFALPNGDLRFYEGRCEGEIVFPARGSQGHGYDPVFRPYGATRTFAEMSLAEKNRWSHRSQAVKLFLKDCFV